MLILAHTLHGRIASGPAGPVFWPDHFRLEFEGVVIFSERARAAVYYLTRPAALRMRTMRTLHRINHIRLTLGFESTKQAESDHL